MGEKYNNMCQQDIVQSFVSAMDKNYIIMETTTSYLSHIQEKQHYSYVYRLQQQCYF
jgi:hypothetical protein